jgi:ABC-2 type transport system permease protein
MQKTGKSQDEIIKFKKELKDKNPLSGISQTIENISLAKIIFCFLFFYIGGYLIYSSLFAAIGSAVENASEAQQFMFPVTIPIILSFVLGQVIIQEPDSQLAFWASMFPLTSPIDMMVRLPFGVPNWQIALSLTLLILGFLGTTWLAGKVYRVGILMYGKKPSWKEIAKWVFYKG